jgi:hypothetical protein
VGTAAAWVALARWLLAGLASKATFWFGIGRGDPDGRKTAWGSRRKGALGACASKPRYVVRHFTGRIWGLLIAMRNEC